MRFSRWPALALVTCVGGLAAPGAASAAYDPCPSQAVQSWMGASKAHAVTIPSLTRPNGISSYAGTVFKPGAGARYPGRRPLVLLQHGLGGQECNLDWAARDLAGHGFTAMIWTSPAEPTPAGSFVNGVDATRSALAFAGTSSNPYAARTDTTRMAIGGHSMGSIVASDVQQDRDPGVKAIVAFDTLRRYVSGDPGGAVNECTMPQGGEITPVVPALGFAMDLPCAAKPEYAPPDLKEVGFKQWRSHGVPSMELVMRGFNHLSFTTAGTEQQHRYVGYYVLAWMKLWLEGKASQRDKLVATTVKGADAPSILSATFLSGAFLPGTVKTNDFARWLTEHAGSSLRAAAP